jgi:hypothetical protein
MSQHFLLSKAAKTLSLAQVFTAVFERGNRTTLRAFVALETRGYLPLRSGTSIALVRRAARPAITAAI